MGSDHRGCVKCRVLGFVGKFLGIERSIAGDDVEYIDYCDDLETLFFIFQGIPNFGMDLLEKSGCQQSDPIGHLRSNVVAKLVGEFQSDYVWLDRMAHLFVICNRNIRFFTLGSDVRFHSRDANVDRPYLVYGSEQVEMVSSLQ
ncbi:hypothetical protein [uncultured Rikenella sp.]|uniref:hypothetical protein n=1 Tax=uncultured Rikenella sp. TaxID=368003 RepID=UPI00260ADA46|nr:hypothetical protein [uncultured Rikenella sp.]